MAKLADAIYFDYIEELCYAVLNRLETDEDAWVSVVGKYDDIRAFIKDFLTYDDVNFECLNICDPKHNDYTSEYVVDIWTSDGKIVFDCAPAKVDDEYDYYKGDVLYMLEGTKQALADNCEYAEKYFVIRGEEDFNCAECYCDECYSCDKYKDEKCVEYSKTDDGDIHGFSASRTDDKGCYSYSFYTSDTLNKGDIRDMLKEFGFQVYLGLK